jgi:hypothetical protein
VFADLSAAIDADVLSVACGSGVLDAEHLLHLEAEVMGTMAGGRCWRKVGPSPRPRLLRLLLTLVLRSIFSAEQIAQNTTTTSICGSLLLLSDVH